MLMSLLDRNGYKGFTWMTPTELRLRRIKTDLNWDSDGEVVQEELSNLQTRLLLFSRQYRHNNEEDLDRWVLISQSVLLCKCNTLLKMDLMKYCVFHWANIIYRKSLKNEDKSLDSIMGTLKIKSIETTSKVLETQATSTAKGAGQLKLDERQGCSFKEARPAPYQNKLQKSAQQLHIKNHTREIMKYHAA
ncbi:hypothetical protein H5410_033629 [Solanum commersonii]|uniref:Uncharacterized protein n=1 Tax=Solanum commersonii TaxID=4109 RepID=A0A9J5YND8_SOLCO|nr:hypothetical protein H5410_033629 [Solanum commersonii]